MPAASNVVVHPTAVPPAGGDLTRDHHRADTQAAIAQIERYVRLRRDTDRPLISWGLYFFLLSWLTLGVYPVIVFYQRLNRADLFSDRRHHYYEAVVDYTTRYADDAGRAEDVHYETDDLASYVKGRFITVHQPIKAGLSVLLSFATLGIYGYISVYRLMKYWWEIQVTEQDFCEKLSPIWTELGIIRYPISYELIQRVRRNFWTCFLLSIVTIGVYGIWWDYYLHTDPDRVYPEMHSSEEAVLNAARSARAGGA